MSCGGQRSANSWGKIEANSNASLGRPRRILIMPNKMYYCTVHAKQLKDFLSITKYDSCNGNKDKKTKLYANFYPFIIVQQSNTISKTIEHVYRNNANTIMFRTQQSSV